MTKTHDDDPSKDFHDELTKSPNVTPVNHDARPEHDYPDEGPQKSLYRGLPAVHDEE